MSFYYAKKGLTSMNYKKCMKHSNCKTCSDYKYCKDDIENKRKDRRKKTLKGRR